MTSDNYATIVENNVDRIFQKPPADLAAGLPGKRSGEGIGFSAFGEPCRIAPDGIELAGEKQTGPLGIVISLYALNAGPAAMVLESSNGFGNCTETTVTALYITGFSGIDILYASVFPSRRPFSAAIATRRRKWTFGPI